MYLTNFPLVLLVVAIVVLSASARLGTRLAHRIEGVREDFAFVASATFTLLSLLIGFTFSMAVGRYDHRKLLEAEEASAISLEYGRADLLAAGGDTLKRLIADYLAKRIMFYRTRDAAELRRTEAETGQLQRQMWATITANAFLPSPLTPLAVSGMGDLLKSERSTRSAWMNRIPRLVWVLLGGIALCSNLMFGLSRPRNRASMDVLFWIFPILISLTLFLIADIDSPRGGLVDVEPENLMSVAATL